MLWRAVEAVALGGPLRVCVVAAEIPNTFLESPDMVLSLVPDPGWCLKVDQISPTLFCTSPKLDLENPTFGLKLEYMLENGFHQQCVLTLLIA